VTDKKSIVDRSIKGSVMLNVSLRLDSQK